MTIIELENELKGIPQAMRDSATNVKEIGRLQERQRSIPGEIRAVKIAQLQKANNRDQSRVEELQEEVKNPDYQVRLEAAQKAYDAAAEELRMAGNAIQSRIADIRSLKADIGQRSLQLDQLLIQARKAAA